MNESIIELIGRRRRQILVHSYIYYRLNSSIIDDGTWSKWALELYNLQKDFPNESVKAPLYDEFVGFDYSTGSDLPLGEPWIENAALKLMHISENK